MKRIPLLLATVLAFAAVAVHAESPDRSGQFSASARFGKSRAEVLAELKEARRTGDILAAGDAGATEYERNPSAFPARAQVAGKTREQVRAETLQAIAEGDIRAGELGVTLREAYPSFYMARDAARAQRTAAMPQPAMPR
ncbi:MAG TPA: DUF4148 domain-containing protein [Ramlibacter sp.]|jgi:hypothetical protein|nr:DUF4148 domain-containing protein [Ramlibacter sp.]